MAQLILVRNINNKQEYFNPDHLVKIRVHGDGENGIHLTHDQLIVIDDRELIKKVLPAFKTEYTPTK